MQVLACEVEMKVVHYEGFAEDTWTHITYAASIVNDPAQVTCKICLRLLDALKDKVSDHSTRTCAEDRGR